MRFEEKGAVRMKKHMKIMILTSIVTLLPILVGLALWQQLPAEVPTHWNGAGEVDGYSSKTFAVMGLPLILVAVQWFMGFIVLADPKNRNISEPVMKLVFWIIPALSLVMNTAVYFIALGVKIPIERITPVLVGVLFVALGIYMPRCKQNYTVGFKMAWTLNSEENWNRTHRFAGPVWIVAGVLAILFGLFGLVIPMLVVLAAAGILPMIYSFVLYRKGI